MESYRKCPNLNVAVPSDAGELWFRRAKWTAPKQRLFCFPYAGGSARLFRSWHEWLAPEIEAIAVELPGRGFHVRSPLIDDIDEMIAQILTVIDPLIDIPFALFGHSMGALIAFELSVALRRTERNLPAHLFVSAMCAPHAAHLRKMAHHLPDSEFLNMLRSLNGTSADALDDRGLLELFLPILRADFRLAETYMYTPQPPLPHPITVFGGLADPTTPADSLPAWGKHTAGECSIRLLEGDHFFIHHHDHVMAASISKSLLTSPNRVGTFPPPSVSRHNPQTLLAGPDEVSSP
ncbi:MAG TPA: alpha/beta fold hydrolase [Candidatus Polarisedimenticolia bacterium]|nr:alpha/beta fold hydrolase [Candidatus Polarisedimenticolia bacterium]